MKKLICIVCPNGCHLEAEQLDGELKVTGNKCPRGIAFATEEMTAPKRSVTSTVPTIFAELPFVPVRTKGEIPKEKMFELMKLINTIKLDRAYACGETVLSNVLDTGIDLIVTMNMQKIVPSK